MLSYMDDGGDYLRCGGNVFFRGVKLAGPETPKPVETRPCRYPNCPELMLSGGHLCREHQALEDFIRRMIERDY